MTFILIVIVLTVATPMRGTFLVHQTTHPTRAECERTRQEFINIANRDERINMISTCDTKAEFHMFFKVKDVPKPVQPPVYDEKPLPPSAPAKPDWERAA